MGKGLENYIGVAPRLVTAQAAIKGLTVYSDVNISWEKECALVKITIKDGETIKAQAHALAGDLSDEKALEKAETAAVGRALGFMGYPAEATGEGDEAGEETTTTTTKTEKKGLGTGLGGKKPAPALGAKSNKKTQEEAEETSGEEENQEETKPAKPALKGGGLLAKLNKAPAKKVEEEEEQQEESESAEDGETSGEDESSEGSEEQQEEEQEQEAPPAKKVTTATSSKLGDVMAKYNLKK